MNSPNDVMPKIKSRRFTMKRDYPLDVQRYGDGGARFQGDS
jgi:hypothetical protein